MAPLQRRRSIDSSSSPSSESSPPSYTPSTSTTTTTTTTTTTSTKTTTTTTTTTTVGVVQPPELAMPVPPSGYRIPLSVGGPLFPGVDRTGAAPFTDLHGTPVFIGSALMQDSMHPCKISPNNNHPCFVPYDGNEVIHQGRYDLLPFVPEQMEFVPTSHGHVPLGRRPVKGGFERDGSELYHAVAVIDGFKVPGKTGTHLGGCNVPWDGQERKVKDTYEIL